MPGRLKKIKDLETIDISTIFSKDDAKYILHISKYGGDKIGVSVLDYEDDDVRNNLVKPDEILIPDEKIMIRLNYPKSWFMDFENKGGFSRMDLFRCIYEAHKELWGENSYLSELQMEGIYYDAKRKVAFLSIGI